MTPTSARLRSTLLLYAAVQFIVLTTIAMAVYADRYQFLGNSLSDLGATHAWSGRANHPAMILFSVALTGLGLAFIGFAGTWRAFDCSRRAVSIAGVTAQAFGTLSGLAFIAVAFAPVNVVVKLHNALVISAFGLLLGYVVATTVVWACNGAPRTILAATGIYLVLVMVYFGVVAMAVDRGAGTMRGYELMVISQKCFAYVSMLLIAYVTLTTRGILSRTIT
jgi:hypothetical protein